MVIAVCVLLRFGSRVSMLLFIICCSRLSFSAFVHNSADWRHNAYTSRPAARHSRTLVWYGDRGPFSYEAVIQRGPVSIICSSTKTLKKSLNVGNSFLQQQVFPFHCNNDEYSCVSNVEFAAESTSDAINDIWGCAVEVVVYLVLNLWVL